MPAQTPDNQPTHVYKLIQPNDWDQALKTGAIPVSALDQADGFMHLSSKAQFMETANLHYTDYPEILCIELIVKKLKGDLLWEPAKKRDGALFPHLYGHAPIAAVNAVHLLKRQQDQSFTNDGLSSEHTTKQ